MLLYQTYMNIYNCQGTLLCYFEEDVQKKLFISKHINVFEIYEEYTSQSIKILKSRNEKYVLQINYYRNE